MKIRQTIINVKAAVPLAVLLTCLISGATAANASAFLDNFDSVTPLSLQNDSQVNYAAISPYFRYGSNGNGVVTNCVGSGCDLTSGNPVTSDASGKGNFLFENTAGDGPKGQNVFYVSNSFTVLPNTKYIFGFDVTNATTCCYAGVDSSIKGNNSSVDDFSPVTANGPSVNQNGYTQWIPNSFVWNSGTSTSATITLSDSNLAGYGNDFGIDDISVSSVPEPATWAVFLAGFGGLGAVLRSRRRAATAQA